LLNCSDPIIRLKRFISLDEDRRLSLQEINIRAIGLRTTTTLLTRCHILSHSLENVSIISSRIDQVSNSMRLGWCGY